MSGENPTLYLQDGASDAEVVMTRTEFRAYGQFWMKEFETQT